MNRSIILLGVFIVILTYIYCTINQTYKPTKKVPYIHWNDVNNPPVPGFEQHVDMYYSTHQDTIYMERSYGPKAE